jgi:branched-chain amino acid transport system ATP-binding protein
MVLKLNNVHAFYGQSHVLHGIIMNIEEGQIVTLLGRNGVGKSTALKSIMGLVPPREGSIQFKGKEIAGLKPYQISRAGIGYIPEERRIFPTLTVRQNLLVGIKPKQNINGGWTVEKVYSRFPQLEMRDRQNGAHLSGGEQQMLAMGRALMGNPELLLVDEPTEGLSPLLVDMVVSILEEARNAGIPILLVSQAVDLALGLADKVYMMSKGEIVFEGTNKEFYADEEIIKKYIEV